MESSISIRVYDMNEVLQDPNLLANLRRLTLKQHPDYPSGMNWELTCFQNLRVERNVSAWAITAYKGHEMVGWGLASKEPTSFTFVTEFQFEGQGILFEVFVNYMNRKSGIASMIFQKAHEMFPNEMLYVCPWDEASQNFYQKQTHIPYQAI